MVSERLNISGVATQQVIEVHVVDFIGSSGSEAKFNLTLPTTEKLKFIVSQQYFMEV